MKKIISTLLTLALVASSFTFLAQNNEVYGAEDQSKEMEKVLVEVKKVISVPNNLTEFDYNFQNGDKAGEDEDIWMFNWSDKEMEHRISATANASGKILSYREYIEGVESGISKLTYKEGEVTAMNFIKKTYPELASNMKLLKNYGNNSEIFNYNFMLHKDNIPVDFVKINLSVNKMNNKVYSFDFIGDTTISKKFPSKNGVISEEQAKKHYLSNDGTLLKYLSNIDYKTGNIKMFPAYSLKDFNLALDSITGEKVELQKRNIGIYAKDAGGANEASAERSGLTPGEIAEIDKVSSLISKENAEQKAKSYLAHLNSITLQNSKLYKNYLDKDQFYWNFSFENGHISIDAKTGGLISFYTYENDNGKESNIDKNKVKQIGEDYIKNVAKNQKVQMMKEEATDSPFELAYYRQENGISVESNQLSVTVDKNTGKVSGYNFTWYDKATFPSIEKAFNNEKAFVIFNESGKFQLIYVKDSKGEIKLVYKMTEPTNFYVDPINGTKLDYKGSPYVNSVVPEYTDISSHWCETTVNTLKNNGYYLDGTTFSPSKKITQENFLRYLYSPNQRGYDSEEFYKMMERSAIVKPGEKSPNSELMRKDAAKFVIRLLGQDKAASFSKIYKNTFTDNVEADYMGYAVLSNAFEIIKGDKYGRFLGNNTMTNAEAALVVYRTLNVK